MQDHNVFEVCVIWKLSLHSESKKYFVTTLSRQSVLQTHIEQEQGVWASAHGTKCRIEDMYCCISPKAFCVLVCRSRSP